MEEEKLYCPHCGGDIDATGGPKVQCPYCGETVENTLYRRQGSGPRPRREIPFKTTEEDCLKHFYKHLANTDFVPTDIFEKIKVTKVEKETMPRPVWHVYYEYAGVAYHYSENGETGSCINSNHPTSKEEKEKLARIPNKQRHAIIAGCLFLVAGIVLCIVASAAVYPIYKYVRILSIALMALAIAYPIILYIGYEKEKAVIMKVAKALRHNGMRKMPGMGSVAKCKVPLSIGAVHKARLGAIVLAILCVAGFFVVLNYQVGTSRADEVIKNVPQFMGIPVDGSQKVFYKHLEKKGIEKFSWGYTGDFYWGDDNVTTNVAVRAETMNKRVWRVVVSENWHTSSLSEDVVPFIQQATVEGSYVLWHGDFLSEEMSFTESSALLKKMRDLGLAGVKYVIGFTLKGNNTLVWIKDGKFYFENPTILEDKSNLSVQSIQYCYNVGRKYYAEKDYASAIKYFQIMAESNGTDRVNYAAQYRLGQCYYYGCGVQQNYKEAVKWYRKAEQNWAEAQIALGNCYFNGHGVEQSYAKAIEYYSKAAEAVREGYISYEYVSKERFYVEVMKLYRQVAEQGIAEAQYQLGYCYEEGQGVEQDDYMAFVWYIKAANQGHAEAQYRLGIESDFREYDSDYFSRDSVSIMWLTRAAEQGHVEAQYELGNKYSYGLDWKERNSAEAAKWYRKAAEQGHSNAKSELNYLSNY